MQDESNPTPTSTDAADMANVNTVTVGFAPAVAASQLYTNAAMANQIAYQQAAAAQQTANMLMLATTASGVNQILDLKPKRVWAFVTSQADEDDFPS